MIQNVTQNFYIQLKRLPMQMFECLTSCVTIGKGIAVGGVDIGLGEVLIISLHSLRLKNIISWDNQQQY